MDLPPPDRAYSVDFDEECPDGHAFGRPRGLRPGQWPLSEAALSPARPGDETTGRRRISRGRLVHRPVSPPAVPRRPRR